MTNLFSTKQIVGVCFLIIGVSLYIVTGFDFNISLPSMEILDINPFKDPYEGLNSLQKEITQNAKPFVDLLGHGPKTDQSLHNLKSVVDNATCAELDEMYRINTGWTIRPYVAYRLLEQGCV